MTGLSLTPKTHLVLFHRNLSRGPSWQVVDLHLLFCTKLNLEKCPGELPQEPFHWFCSQNLIIWNSLWEQCGAWASEKLLHLAQIGISKGLTKKTWNSTHFMLWFWRLLKPLQLISLAAQFKFESKYESLQFIWQSLRRLFQKVIEGLEGKTNCQQPLILGLLGHLSCLLGLLSCSAQTQGVSN